MPAVFVDPKPDTLADRATRGVRPYPRGSSSDLLVMRMASFGDKTGRLVSAGHVRTTRPESDDGQADLPE